MGHPISGYWTPSVIAKPVETLFFDIEDTLPQSLAQAVAFCGPDLPHPTMVSIEYRMWVRKWKQHTSDFPKKLIDVLQACDPVTFPNVRVLLQLALTLPITSCESEEFQPAEAH